MPKPDNAPSRWMLGGDAPEPQTWPEPKVLTDDERKRLATEPGPSPADTHTGTDPLGRAIGPAEDHTKPKPIMNDKGEVVTPKRPARARRS